MNSLRGLLAATALSLFCLHTWAGNCLADPPLGDTCGSAIPLVWGSDWAYAGDLTSCANDYDPAVPGPSCTGSAAPGRDMVFAMELNCAMGTQVYMGPENFDGAVYIVTDCSDIAGSCVAGSDHGGLGITESFFLIPSGFQTYYLIVDAHESGTGGPFNLSFEFFSLDSWMGACCFPDGHCEFQDFGICGSAGGVSLGPCTTCTPNPCAPTPVSEESWGAIKRRYR